MSDFGMLAQRLAAITVKLEEMNEEWEILQRERTRVIEALRGTLAFEEEAITEIIPVPDHVRLRRSEVPPETS